LLLRKKAAEELKKEQERKAAERRRVIDQRCGKQRPTEGLSKGSIKHFIKILKQNSSLSLLGKLTDEFQMIVQWKPLHAITVEHSIYVN
jgi:hypothetical protein